MKPVARRAFTLIELLVVIAIIAVVAAMLFPVFAQAREKARGIQCLSNQKGLGTAILMYAQDYDDAVVPWVVNVTEYPGETYGARFWVGRLQQYVKNGGASPAEGVFRCPSFTEDHLREAARALDCDPRGVGLDPYFPAREIYSHYGIAFGMYMPAGTGTQSDPFYHFPGSHVFSDMKPAMNLTTFVYQVLRPSETAVISDGTTMIGGGFLVLAFGCESARTHQGGGNFVFLDGHSKWIARNAERYLKQRADGKWFKQYFTYSME